MAHHRPRTLDARVQFTYTWTGSELVIYGGSDAKAVFETEPDPSDVYLDTGAVYDPTTDTWRRIPQSGEPRLRQQAVWDGEEVVVLGGDSSSDDEPSVLALDTNDLTWR